MEAAAFPTWIANEKPIAKEKPQEALRFHEEDA
jgi:hypothetical protein